MIPIESMEVDKTNNNSLNDNNISSDSFIFRESFRDSFILVNNYSFYQPTKNKFSNIPFVVYFFILIFLLAISIIIYYIHYYTTTKPNFKILEIDWISPKLDNRKYQRYLFDNGLEVMLIQDVDFDRDGGAIVIDKGYLENPFEEGLAVFANDLLSHLVFNDTSHMGGILSDYFGNYNFFTDGDFINFSFDILNNGFKKIIRFFSSILDFKDINNFESHKNNIINLIEANYQENNNYISMRENHLLEYLVYGFKNENNEEILPEGNMYKLNQTNISQIKNYINKIIDPSKIKIVLFSKYKFLITSKYMKYYFKYLTNKEKLEDKNNNENDNDRTNWRENLVFNKSQIFYINAYDYEFNYLKIVYFIDKVNNATFPELFYKQQFFLYISDFIKKKKNGSLYSRIKNNIKSIETETEVILREKIKYTIIFDLTSLENINDLIYLTYQYIHKIIKELEENKFQRNRYLELSQICFSNQNLTENSYDTMSLAYANAQGLITHAYAQKYYFYYSCIPLNEEYKNNESKLNEDISPYLRQLRPNNSVIILAIRDKDKQSLTCNKTSRFYLNCDDIKNNTKNTNYYDIQYMNDIFNSTQLEQYLNEDIDDFDIKYEPNKFKTKNDQPDDPKEENNEIINITNDGGSSLNRFYFKRNVEKGIQKVLIKLNLYHPYLRPNNPNDKNGTKCHYFLVLEMFSAIKRKINEVLSEAILAENKIEFGQTENYLYILIYCFSDQANYISQIINNIIYDDWQDDFLINNEIYKNEAFNDFLLFDKNEIYDISRYYFKSVLKSNFYNKYEFFPGEFEQNYYNICINKTNLSYLNMFAIEGYIYGYYDENEAKEIYKIFNINNYYAFNELILEVKINVSPKDFIKWIKSIVPLGDDIREQNQTIKAKIYNKTEDGNFGVTYRLFNEGQLNLSIFQNVINNLGKNGHFSLIGKNLIVYGYYFFELIFESGDESILIPNDDLVWKEWEQLLDDNSSSLNIKVDNIGTRYYYLIKNYYVTLGWKQMTLYDKALNEINSYDYNDTFLNYSKILEEYDEKYKNKRIESDELDITINYYKNKINETKKINIFTTNQEL